MQENYRRPESLNRVHAAPQASNGARRRTDELTLTPRAAEHFGASGVWDSGFWVEEFLTLRKESIVFVRVRV